MKAFLNMSPSKRKFTLRLARDAQDLTAAQRLRYRVFVQELGGNGPLVDHDAQLEIDEFDPICDHLILIDPARDATNLDHVIGVYRLLRQIPGAPVQKFYTEGEYDLSKLRTSRRRLLELGRSCVHADYRNGEALYHLWRGLADYVAQYEIDILFGVASFHGTDAQHWAAQLSLLHHRYLAPDDLRVQVRQKNFQSMDLITMEQIDRVATMRDIPALIKAYLRLGGYVGAGAFVDHKFNTTDVCLILDTARMDPDQRALYTRPAAK